MTVHLFRAQWQVLRDYLAEPSPKMAARIEEGLKSEGDIIAIEGEVPGWRFIADRIEGDFRTIANLIRLMASACVAADHWGDVDEVLEVER